MPTVPAARLVVVTVGAVLSSVDDELLGTVNAFMQMFFLTESE